MFGLDLRRAFGPKPPRHPAATNTVLRRTLHALMAELPNHLDPKWRGTVTYFETFLAGQMDSMSDVELAALTCRVYRVMRTLHDRADAHPCEDTP